MPKKIFLLSFVNNNFQEGFLYLCYSVLKGAFMNNITVDKEKCIQCGLCVNDCISKCLDFDTENYPKMKYTEHCLGCQHCMSICPQGALSFNGKNPDDSDKISNKNILSLIKSRRSVRQYKDEELTEDEWKTLKNMLPYIPTGCNSHQLHFSIVEKRTVMQHLKDKVNNRLIKLLNNKVLSPLVKHFEVYKKAFEKGEDIIFRGAPHMVVVSSPITAPCAPQDPVIALSYLELYAQSLGYGTCWCGYATICIKLFPEICDILEIPKGYSPIYAMLIGKPAVKYQRTIQPEPYKISEIKDVIQKDSCIWCKTKRFFTNFLRG